MAAERSYGEISDREWSRTPGEDQTEQLVVEIDGEEAHRITFSDGVTCTARWEDGGE